MGKRQPKASTNDQADEFERFESLTKRLVSVPKKEIDKARARDGAKRNGRPR
jgi:hypothetical protein